MMGLQPNLGLTMPVDMAVQLYIAHSPPLHSFLSSYESYRARNLVNVRCKPLRPCINTRNNSQSVSPKLNPPCHIWQGAESKVKKKVVFADSKGMSLTAVRVFCPSDNQSPRSESPLQFHLPKLECAVNEAQSRILDFQQPSANYVNFRDRLMKNSVCLESCVLQGRTLTGTVKVLNLAFEKLVRVRVTYDSWTSHREVECTYMNDVYGGKDTDTFSFVTEIPGFVPPQNGVEFCVNYAAGGRTYWDNNDGKNYGLVPTRGEKFNKGNDSLRQIGAQKKCIRLSAGWKHWMNLDVGAPC